MLRDEYQKELKCCWSWTIERAAAVHPCHVYLTRYEHISAVSVPELACSFYARKHIASAPSAYPLRV